MPATLLRWLPAAISLALIAIIGWTTRASLTQLDESSVWQRRAYQVAQASQDLLGSLTDTQRGARGYILSKRPEALQLYQAAVVAIPTQLRALGKLLPFGAHGQTEAPDVDAAVADVLVYTKRLLTAYERDGMAGASALESTGEGLAVMNRARDNLAHLSASARGVIEQRLQSLGAEAARARRLVSLEALAALALLLFANAMAGREAGSRRNAEERFRFLVDGVKDYALLMLAEDGTILSWNTGAQRSYGYTASEIIGKHFSRFYRQTDRLRAHPENELRIATRDGRYEEEGWRVRKDGSQFLVSVVVTAIRDPLGRLRGFAKITHDITELRQREQEIKEQARILDLANDTIFMRDMEDRIIFWNQGAQRVYGWTKQEAIGQVTHTLLKTRFPLPLVDIKAQMERDGHWEGELQHVRRDGALLTVASRWTLRRDEDGNVRGVIEMNYDITERIEMAEMLQKKNAELLMASRAKDSFLANMSHELRTPLNGIIGFSELLHDGLPGPLNPKQQEFLGDILSSGRHLLQLINDLLDLSKVGAGKMDLYAESFDLGKVIEDACQTVRPGADKKGVTLLHRPDAQLGEVRLDRQRCKQILFNLLSNAVKFTREGGTVEVSTQRLDTARFAVSVRDTGIGIAAEDMQRLFKEFEQLDSGMTRRYQGTGLGLALTRKLVSLQDGHIDVQSELGRGTTFRVELPLVWQGSTP